MDLIYSDINRTDQGVIKAYSLDIAFGKDENDFSLTIPLDNHCCKAGCYVYIDGTEYGGIIDRIKTDSISKEITYSGRTWHGILATHIIEPVNDYRYFNGDANSVIGEILGLCGVDYFEAEIGDSGFMFRNYQVPRYIDAYSLIRKMLSSVGARLSVKMRDKQVVFSAVSAIDYSGSSWIDSNAVGLRAERNASPTNHLICLGNGDLSERFVIHLFTDAYGNIQAYKKVDAPLSDADYITDKSKMIMNGSDEVADIYDYPNAEAKMNYIALTEQPSDWRSDAISSYYKINGESYEPLESWLEDVYVLTEYEPVGWSTEYSQYYQKDGSNYVSVEYIDPTYELLTAKPEDFDVYFKSYYIKSGSEYIPVTITVLDNSYVLLESKPVYWGRDYSMYFEKKNNRYVKVEAQEIESEYYQLLEQKPDWWEDYYKDCYYYFDDGTGATYKKIQGNRIDDWVLTISRPSNWEVVYKDYYRLYTDEVWKYVYERSVLLYESYYLYIYSEKRWNAEKGTWESTEVKQTTQTGNIYEQFYVKEFVRTEYVEAGWKKTTEEYYDYREPYENPREKFVLVDRKLMSSNTYYEKGDYRGQKFEEWEPNKWYIKTTKTVAPSFEDYSNIYGVYQFIQSMEVSPPEWEANKYYEYVTNRLVYPEWAENTYYRYIRGHYPTWAENIFYKLNKDVVFYPQFTSGMYFRRVFDHFSELVKGGIEILKTAWATDTIELSVNDAYIDYAVGDIIGAEDDKTGISAKQQINKKIVKIANGEIQYSYETEER